MNLSELLEYYYQTLRQSGDVFYDVGGVRAGISSDVMNLLDVLDDKDRYELPVDAKILSFLGFVGGYDTPGCGNDEYLFDDADLDREYKELGNIDSLDGAGYEI